ncbi:hypothetical protein VP01_3129g1, partial [Puccinia sorghi]
PRLSHWKEVKKTWQYLRHSKDLKFTIYPVEPNQFLSIFSDATWGDDPDSRTSQSSYLCYLFGSLILWNSCRQRSITYSLTEAELNPLLTVDDKTFKEKYCTNHLIDNKGLNDKLKKFGSNSKTRHINLRTKGLRQEIKSKNIKITLVKTHEMIADALTKPTSIEPLKKLIKTSVLVLVRNQSLQISKLLRLKASLPAKRSHTCLSSSLQVSSLSSTIKKTNHAFG